MIIAYMLAGVADQLSRNSSHALLLVLGELFVSCNYYGIPGYKIYKMRQID